LLSLTKPIPSSFSSFTFFACSGAIRRDSQTKFLAPFSFASRSGGKNPRSGASVAAVFLKSSMLRVSA